eukprot:TRINITY_DN2919_c0_g3_i3.p1 TRINITY_DN2919_c0_g3~~TRINITY_DN2919_c0_g3_i3.p1  ORF type:complete len:425 (-),score=119.64 TRINITY_DN2919_c0_g3_i3:1074-2348(-)
MEETALENKESVSMGDTEPEMKASSAPDIPNEGETANEDHMETEDNDQTDNNGQDDKIEVSPSKIDNPTSEGTTPKRKYKSRDENKLSPEVVGKRQRKTLSIEKKTSNILEGIDGKSHIQTIVTENASIAIASVPGEPLPKISLGRKDVMLTPKAKTKKLPKGYAFEPVFEAVESPKSELPSKRERKRSSNADEPYEEEKISKQPKEKREKTKPKKTKPAPKKTKKVPADEMTAQMLKKKELESQLNAIAQQLADVKQSIESKAKLVEKSDEEEPKNKRKSTGSKKGKRGSVYDRFDSDDEVPTPKKKEKKEKKEGPRSQRNKRKSVAVDEISEEEEAPAPVIPAPIVHIPAPIKNENVDESKVVEAVKPAIKLLLNLKKNHHAWPFFTTSRSCCSQYSRLFRRHKISHGSRNYHGEITRRTIS